MVIYHVSKKLEQIVTLEGNESNTVEIKCISLAKFEPVNLNVVCLRQHHDIWIMCWVFSHKTFRFFFFLMEIFKSMEVWFEMLAASQFFSIALDISTNKWVELLVMLISRTFIHHLHLLNYYLTFINGRVMNTTISIHSIFS